MPSLRPSFPRVKRCTSGLIRSESGFICYTTPMQPIHEHHFYQYLSCPNWIYWEREEWKTLEMLERRLMMDGLLPEMNRKILESRGYDEVDEEDHEEAFARTVELMEKGVDRILHGALVHGRYVSRPDILERVEGRSRFGDYYYVACDIKRSHRLTREAKVAGVFHAEVLGLIQNTRPTQGYVMDPKGDVQSFLINEIEGEYHLTLLRLEETLEGDKPREFLSSHCKRSPWFAHCKQGVESCDHLSRINRIWIEEVEMFERAGYKRVSQLAKVKSSTLEKNVPGMKLERLRFLHRQAQSLISGKHDLVEPVALPSAPVELYFDIEADPLRDLDYLFGVLEIENGKETYHAFLAKSPGEEGEAWAKFLTFVAEHPGPVYHYGWYEIEVVRRLAQKYGSDEALVEALLKRMVDLLGLVRPKVIFPLSFYSLKDLAAYAGFSWRNAEASGAGSILWYEDWLAFNDEKKLKDILEYNEDDVRATYVLKKWLEEYAT